MIGFQLSINGEHNVSIMNHSANIKMSSLLLNWEFPLEEMIFHFMHEASFIVNKSKRSKCTLITCPYTCEELPIMPLNCLSTTNSKTTTQIQNLITYVFYSVFHEAIPSSREFSDIKFMH